VLLKSSGLLWFHQKENPTRKKKKPQVKRLEALSWFVEGVFLDFTLLPISGGQQKDVAHPTRLGAFLGISKQSLG
jgi:hypothetical protein